MDHSFQEEKMQDGEIILDPTNVFVKYLPADMDDGGLEGLFSAFGKIVSAKVMLDPRTWTSLGYGFVKFSTQEEAQLAICRMAGFKIHNKTLLCKLSNVSNFHLPSPNLYIKPLPPTCTEEMLDQIFGKFGQIETIKIVRDPTKSKDVIGLVKYDSIESAAKAVHETHGVEVIPGWRAVLVKYAESDSERAKRKANLSPPLSPRNFRQSTNLTQNSPPLSPVRLSANLPQNVPPSSPRHQFTNLPRSAPPSPLRLSANLTQSVPPPPLSPVYAPFTNQFSNEFSPNFSYAMPVSCDYMWMNFQHHYMPLVFYPVPQEPLGWYNSYHQMVYPAFISSK
eukprot:Phypoly_transcript_10717.p1 GENE.Phypoly_transcript_10717~~Phypoly_transcript_10717.p1  ORF type:complete len:337 (+),score=61.65 Phypoly_transcript_10717:180-1190(+)